jgi:hypothetical protein
MDTDRAPVPVRDHPAFAEIVRLYAAGHGPGTIVRRLAEQGHPPIPYETLKSWLQRNGRQFRDPPAAAGHASMDTASLLAVQQDVPTVQPKVLRHPSGWEPGVDTARGVIVTPPVLSSAPPEDWSELLAEFGLDPDRWEVVSDSVQVRAWDSNVGGGEIARIFY